jgi:DNA-binding IclR family transcriptional regulator
VNQMNQENKHYSRNVIQSLDRGLIIMEYLSRSQDHMGLPELAQLLDVDPSTVYRLLGTLLNRGFVVQDPVSKKYTLGLKVIELSRRAIDTIQIRVTSKSYLRKLVDETGESSNLAIFSDKAAICIDHKMSQSPLAVTNEIGESFIYHATAIGKVILAFQPEDIREQILANYTFERFTHNTISSVGTLKNQLELIRNYYFSVDDEERFLGVRCIAAPIFDFTEKLIAGIGITGPSSRLSLDRFPSLITQVKKTGYELSIMSGFPQHKAYPIVDSIHQEIS